MGVITFNGISSDTLGIEVVRPPHFRYAERYYSFTEIPGKSGDALINAGGYKNVEAEYDLNFIVDPIIFSYTAALNDMVVYEGNKFVFDGTKWVTYSSSMLSVNLIGRSITAITNNSTDNPIFVTKKLIEDSTFEEMSARISEWLHSGSGYCKLEDTYNPNWYRMGSYYESNTIENILDGGGKFTIRFNCKPQKWLKSGSLETVISQSGSTITNPTVYDSDPLFYVSSTSDGSLTIGDKIIAIKENSANVSVAAGDVVNYGENRFSFDGHVWHSYYEVENPTEYTAVANDMVTYVTIVNSQTQNSRFVFDGTKWVAYTSGMTDIRFVGKSNTIITADAETNPISVTTRFIGETTTAISAGDYNNPVVIANYLAAANDLVLYLGDKFVFDGTKWVSYSSSMTNTRFIGRSTTPISSEATVNPIGLSGMFIDCENGDAYLGPVDDKLNRNKLISCTDFPVLSKGSNTITYSNLTDVRITPRWYMV